MTVIEEWTGRRAHALRTALRLTLSIVASRAETECFCVIGGGRDRKQGRGLPKAAYEQVSAA